MAPGPNGSKKIVETRPGQLTGETLYRDDTGQWWTTEVSQHRATAEARGEVRDGHIFTR